MAADVLTVAVCVSIEQKLNNCVLVVQFSKGTRDYRFLETALGESTKVPPRASLVCLVDCSSLWLVADEISAVRNGSTVITHWIEYEMEEKDKENMDVLVRDEC